MKRNTNKIKYYLKKDKQVESSIQLAFSSGGAYHDMSNPGISHFLEHILASETSKLNHKEHRDYIFTNDLYTNASTSSTLLSLYASGHYSDYQKMVDILCDYIFSPRFDDETIEREREVIIREIAERKGDPGYVLNKFIKENIFEEGSISLVDILGDEQSLKAIKKADLIKRHELILQNSALLVSSIGKGVDNKYVEAKLSEYSEFQKEDKSLYIPSVKNVKNELKKFKVIKLHHDYAHDEVILGIFVPIGITHGNDPVLQIFHEMVFNTPHGILFRILREELRLVYSLSGYYDINLKGYIMNFTLGINNFQESIRVINDIFNKISELILEDKFNIIKSHSIKRNEITFDRPMDVLSYSLNTFLEYEIEDTLDEYVKRLENVNYIDVVNLAKQISNCFPLSQYILVSKNKEINDIEDSVFG